MPSIAVLVLMACMTSDLPERVITEDDTVITESCRVRIGGNAVILDNNNDGVIHIKSSNIVVELVNDSPLRGATPEAAPDTYRGYAIRIDGRKNVTIRGGKISGYWCGIWATNADGLLVENLNASDMRRARLKSTISKEHRDDWMWPHDNDANEWMDKYGGAIYIEDSQNVTIRNCKVRQGQNALILDKIVDSKVFDNDFSFNSGWGIALWRSSRNVISRNAVDFCVRGYSHGVYNRGQDSAGLLAFEQCNDNVFAENSATHCGDGFFGFCGKEALGMTPAPSEDFDYRRRGCNDNLLIGNDFSYAPAHGIEMTFSFGNQYIDNRLVGNAISAIWGGYSQNTLIVGNEISGNGRNAAGRNRGGVLIEYGVGNKILNNKFHDNLVGVMNWVNASSELAKYPWGKANQPASRDNLIAGNSFISDDIAIKLQGSNEIEIGQNKFSDCKQEIDASPESKIEPTSKDVQIPKTPAYKVYGKKRPVGARRELYGRENIVMTEWGPWDHSGPLLHMIDRGSERHVYEMRKIAGEVNIDFQARHNVKYELETLDNEKSIRRVTIRAPGPGEFPYSFEVFGSGFYRLVEETIKVEEPKKE